jgi:hypothetical protein
MMDEGALARLRALTYMDLWPHRRLLEAERLSDPVQFDCVVATVASAYLGQSVALADLPADVLDRVRHQVGCAVRRFASAGACWVWRGAELLAPQRQPRLRQHHPPTPGRDSS